MGTRINVFFDHDLGDPLDQAGALARLLPTTPAALAVRDYWTMADPYSRGDTRAEWQANAVSRLEKKWRRYTGPGSLYLRIAR
jgi:hypothetical protein